MAGGNMSYTRCIQQQRQQDDSSCRQQQQQHWGDMVSHCQQRLGSSSPGCRGLVEEQEAGSTTAPGGGGGGGGGGAAGKNCAVCLEEASGMYFGALVCLPCKSFFIRSTKDGLPRFTCLVNGSCDVTHGNRLRCQYCRFQTCLSVGMCRKEKPEIVQPAEGQVLCRVCHDIANGVHFGVPTCEGCKKFFRRALKESNSYFCKFEKTCAMNPRNRNSCRYCRYNRCMNVGMSRNAIRMGRPKKMGVKDFRHIRESATPYAIQSRRASDGQSSSCSSSPPSSSSQSSFSFQGSPPSISYFPSVTTPSVIKVNGYPAKHTHSDDHKADAGYPTNMQSTEQMRAAMVGERSVIRSCGNPTLRPVGGSSIIVSPQHDSGNFRQTVLTHSGSMNTSGMLRDRAEHQMYQRSSSSSSSSSSSEYAYHPQQHKSHSHSPHSSLPSTSPHSDSSFSSSSSSASSNDTQQESALVDIEDDLADILCTLSQYQLPTAGGSMGRGTNMDSANFNGVQNGSGHLPAQQQQQQQQSSVLCHMSGVVKVESAEFGMSSCQYSGSQYHQQQQYEPVSPQPHSPNNNNNNHSPHFSHPQPTQDTSGVDTSNNDLKMEVADTSSPAPSMSPEHHHNNNNNNIYSAASWSGSATVGAAEREWGSDWGSQPSTLFSQMYNSLMLTYNMGSIGDVLGEDGSGARYPAGNGAHPLQGVPGSHGGPSMANTRMPLYI